MHPLHRTVRGRHGGRTEHHSVRCIALAPHAGGDGGAALAAGILVDNALAPGFVVWLIAGLLIAGVGAVVAMGPRFAAPMRYRERIVTFGVLALWLVVGGLRHHAAWGLRSDDSILTCLPAHRTPARLVGRLESALVIDPVAPTASTPQWARVDRTLAHFQCQAIGHVGAELPVSGLVRLEVTGHLIGPQIGDRLELYGELRAPQRAAEPRRVRLRPVAPPQRRRGDVSRRASRPCASARVATDRTRPDCPLARPVATRGGVGVHRPARHPAGGAGHIAAPGGCAPASTRSLSNSSPPAGRCISWRSPG